MENVLLTTLMCIVLYFFTKICLAVITYHERRVLIVQGSGMIDAGNQGAIQREEDLNRRILRTRGRENFRRRAESRVHPQPQENDERNG